MPQDFLILAKSSTLLPINRLQPAFQPNWKVDWIAKRRVCIFTLWQFNY